jgi:hypothetical protein
MFSGGEIKCVETCYKQFVKEPIGVMSYKTAKAGSDYCEKVCEDTYKKPSESTLDQLLKGIGKAMSDWGIRLSKNTKVMP